LLAAPELYDMSADIGESYDVASAHSDVVSSLRARVIAALKTFPKEIREANTELLEAK
jgi:hypothetical protein